MHPVYCPSCNRVYIRCIPNLASDIKEHNSIKDLGYRPQIFPKIQNKKLFNRMELTPGIQYKGPYRPLSLLVAIDLLSIPKNRENKAKQILLQLYGLNLDIPDGGRGTVA